MTERLTGLFAIAPDGAVRAVLKLDMHFLELVADTVGGLKIFGLAGGFPLFDEFVDGLNIDRRLRQCGFPLFFKIPGRRTSTSE